MAACATTFAPALRRSISFSAIIRPSERLRDRLLLPLRAVERARRAGELLTGASRF